MNKKFALVLIFFILFGFGYLHISNNTRNLDSEKSLVIGEDVKFPDEFDNYIILNCGTQNKTK